MTNSSSHGQSMAHLDTVRPAVPPQSPGSQPLLGSHHSCPGVILTRERRQPIFLWAEKQESESFLIRKVSEVRCKESDKSGEVKSKKKLTVFVISLCKLNSRESDSQDEQITCKIRDYSDKSYYLLFYNGHCLPKSLSLAFLVMAHFNQKDLSISLNIW